MMAIYFAVLLVLFAGCGNNPSGPQLSESDPEVSFAAGKPVVDRGPATFHATIKDGENPVAGVHVVVSRFSAVYVDTTDENGVAIFSIAESGYYSAKAINSNGEELGQWNSIPVNAGDKVERVYNIAQPVAETVDSTQVEVVSIAPNEERNLTPGYPFQSEWVLSIRASHGEAVITKPFVVTLCTVPDSGSLMKDFRLVVNGFGVTNPVQPKENQIVFNPADFMQLARFEEAQYGTRVSLIWETVSGIGSSAQFSIINAQDLGFGEDVVVNDGEWKAIVSPLYTITAPPPESKPEPVLVEESEVVVAPLQPQLNVSSTLVEIGDVTYGDFGTTTFFITNTGDTTLTGTIATSNKHFPVFPKSFILEPDSAQVVTITATPATVGITSTALTIESNGGCDYVQVSMNGIPKVTAVPIIALVQNAAFTDRSAVNPNGVAPSANVPIASFVMTFEHIGDASNLALVIRNKMPLLGFGSYMNNMRIFINNRQVGPTHGTIATPSGEEVYRSYFTNDPITFENSGSAHISVYADLSSNISRATLDAINNAEKGLISMSIESDGVEIAPPVIGQKMYFSEYGHLSVYLDAATPLARHVVMGSADQEVFRFKLPSSPDEDIIVNELELAAYLNEAVFSIGMFANMKLYKNTVSVANRIGSAVNFGTKSTKALAKAEFKGMNLTIPKNSSVVIIVVADVSRAANANSAHIARFVLLPGSIKAIGATSGMLVPVYFGHNGSGVDQEIVGNTMTVYATKIAVNRSAQSPAGMAYSAGSNDQVITRIVVDCAQNVQGYSATIKSMNLALSFTNVLPASAQLKIYKESISISNLVGNTIISTQNQQMVTSMVNIGNIVVSDSENSGFGFEDVEIAPGTSVTFIVTLDTNKLVIPGGNSVINASIQQGGIHWRDGLITQDIDHVDSLPVALGTLVY